MSLLRQRKDEVDWALLETVLPGCIRYLYINIVKLEWCVYSNIVQSSSTCKSA